MLNHALTHAPALPHSFCFRSCRSTPAASLVSSLVCGAPAFRKSRQLSPSKETGEYFIAESTKSSKERTIQLPDVAFAYLKAERIRQEERRLAAGSYRSNPANLVFTNELGEHVKIPTYYNHFKKIAWSIGRPDLRIHDLRHSAATVALAAGADIKSVQQLLGHSSATTTLNIYSHVTEKMASETAARIDGF